MVSIKIYVCGSPFPAQLTEEVFNEMKEYGYLKYDEADDEWVIHAMD